MARDAFVPPLRHEVDRLFDALVHVTWSTRNGEPCWMPAADVAEDADDYRVEMDLPGVRFSDLTITASGRTLRVEGQRERSPHRSAECLHLMERTFGRFVRTFQLPGDADPGGIRAHLSEGVLTIEIRRLRRARKG